MKHSGGLAPLAPTWGDDRLILVLPRTPRIFALGGLPLLGCAVMLLVLGDALVAGIFLGLSALVAAIPFVQPRRVARLDRDQLAVDGWTLDRTRINGVDVDVLSPWVSELRLRTPNGPQILRVHGSAQHARTLARLLRAWIRDPLPTSWGGPDFFRELQPSRLDAEALGALAAFDPEVGPDGVELTLGTWRPRVWLGLALVAAALALAVGVVLNTPFTTVPGVMVGTLAFDAAAVLALLPAPFLAIAGAALAASSPPARVGLRVGPKGVEAGAFRCSHANLREITASGGRLELVGPGGRVVLRHHDAEAVLELRERLWALHEAAREGRSAGGEDLQRLLDRRVRGPDLTS
ncbi:MAG: hypothetical protein H6734_17795 [Alphaproteobacteria bacterium]|nr:hypothetical protein [Alphaproteobacteria bacterium]